MEGIAALRAWAGVPLGWPCRRCMWATRCAWRAATRAAADAEVGSSANLTSSIMVAGEEEEEEQQGKSSRWRVWWAVAAAHKRGAYQELGAQS